jgi:DNA polymerase III sliding clamp (beta) subunit (PCNA family)
MEVKNGKLCLRATNTIMEITAWTAVDAIAEGSCCVDSIVTSLVNNLDEGIIHIKKDTRLNIKQGKHRHNPVYIEADQFPTKVEKTGYALFSVKDLIRAVGLCSAAVSSSNERPVLQSYYINPADKSIVTADGSQVCVFENVDLPGDVALPVGKTLESVMGLLRSAVDDTSFEAAFGAWTGFRTATWEVLINSINGQFPEMARNVVLKSLKDKPVLSVTFMKSELLKVLSMCSMYASRAFQDGKQYHTIFRYFNDKATFAMDVVDLATMDEEVSYVEVNGQDEFEIWFSPMALQELVNRIANDVVELRFFGGMVPFLVLDKQDSQYAYLQVPMAAADKIRQAKEATKKEEPETVEEVDEDEAF